MSFAPKFTERNGYESHVLVENKDSKPEVFLTVARTDQQLKRIVGDFMQNIEQSKLAEYMPELRDGLPEQKMVIVLFLQSTLWVPVRNDIRVFPTPPNLEMMFLLGEIPKTSIFFIPANMQGSPLRIAADFRDISGEEPSLPVNPNYRGLPPNIPVH